MAEQGGRLVPTSKYLFISKESPFIVQHHGNWRMQALQSVRKARSGDLHLSMVVSLSEKDARRLQRRISEFIEEISETIKKSTEEKLMAVGIDFFQVESGREPC